jgi:protein O-GlcNAc transferase
MSESNGPDRSGSTPRPIIGALQNGQSEGEAARLRKATRSYEQGVEHAKKDRWALALECFRLAASGAPNHPRFNYGYGVALCRADRFAEAIEAFENELLVEPNFAPALAEIGTCLARTGRTADGIPYLQRGLSMLPAMPLAQFSLGLALLSENRRTEAIMALNQALQIDRNYADAYKIRGLALIMDGQFDRAMDDLQLAAALNSENHQAIVELGMAFGAAERNMQAAFLFETAVRVSPDLPLPNYAYGQFLINHRQFELGLSHVDRALELDPLHADSYVARGFGFLGQGRVEDAVASYRKAGEIRPDDPNIAGTLLFALQHKPGVTKAELFTEHKRWGTLYSKHWQAVDRFSFANAPDPSRLPRIGIVSADLHNHAVAFLTLRAFEKLAELGHEIFCYSTDKNRFDDDSTGRYKAASVAWREIFELNDADAAKQIADDGIDVLFDLSGHTAGNRLTMFARRAAPIQLSWAGYVGTIGLETYEGVIADPVEIPPEDDEHYVEPVIRLPDCYVCYQPPPDPPEVAPLPCLTKEVFTFGCFNRPAKLNIDVTKAWAAILEQVPNSKILMVYGGLNEGATREALKRLFDAAGLAMDRVEMNGEGQQKMLLNSYSRVDLALDPFPYSGGVTTLEAMWMGVPVVTLRGDTFAGRHSATHLTAAGLKDFCVSSPEEYVALAVSWSQRRDELAQLRLGLRDKVAASPLYDADRFARNMSNELVRLWHEWCREREARSAA